jgi:hypothetical protein
MSHRCCPRLLLFYSERNTCFSIFHRSRCRLQAVLAHTRLTDSPEKERTSTAQHRLSAPSGLGISLHLFKIPINTHYVKELSTAARLILWILKNIFRNFIPRPTASCGQAFTWCCKDTTHRPTETLQPLQPHHHFALWLTRFLRCTL